MDVSVGRNIINASSSDFIAQILGYVFWVSLALFTDSQTIGEIGLIISLVTILGILIPIGLDYSMTKNVGNKIGEKDFSNAKKIINLATILISLFLVITSIIILIFIEPISEISKISETFLQYSIIIIISYTLHNFFRSTIIALQDKTSTIVYTELISQVIKFGITFGLLLFDYGIISVILGFLAHFTFKSIMWGKFIFQNTGLPSIKDFTKPGISKSKLMKEGITMWIPTLIGSLGANLSVLFVNIGNSISDVGIYFVALMIYNTLSRIPAQVQSILFPVMSGYKKSTDQVLEKGMILSLVLIMPFSAMVIGFPEVFLEIFGKNFVSGSYIVSLLASVIIIDTVSVMIITSQLSKGKFRNYNLIVIPASITRITLYYFLVPMYGSIGAAESWVIGSMLGIFITIFMIRQQKIKIDWKKVSLIGIIPIVISFSLKITEINFIISLILIFILSNMLYLKIKIIKREDILYMLNIFLPEEKAEKRYKDIVEVLDKMRL